VVVQFEQRAAAFSAGEHQLGREDFREALRSQMLAKGANDLGLDAEDIQHFRHAQADGAMIENRLQSILLDIHGLEDFDGRSLRARDHLNALGGHFESPMRTWLGANRSIDCDNAFAADVAQVDFCGHDDLRDTAAVAQEKESHAAQIADAMNPAAKMNALPDMRG